jgi:DNA-binding transcriptional LysR family regulator
MLRAGYVDVAVVFRYARDEPGLAFSDDEDGDVDLAEGLRERLLLSESVHLVISAHGQEQAVADLSRYARRRWIAGCDRCRANLLRECALAGFTPKIAFTTDDYVAVQALVAADLGVSTLPALCLRAARHPGIRTVPLPGARRYVLAVRYGDPPDPPAVTLLMDILRSAAVPPQRGPDADATSDSDATSDADSASGSGSDERRGPGAESSVPPGAAR